MNQEDIMEVMLSEVLFINIGHLEMPHMMAPILKYCNILKNKYFFTFLIIVYTFSHFQLVGGFEKAGNF